MNLADEGSTNDGAANHNAINYNAVKYRVGIIGAGFSGLAVAYHLLRSLEILDLPKHIKENFRCLLIEPRPELGAGLAYQTKSDFHLLNVRAKGMSINDKEPSSFVEWLQRSGSSLGADDFAPRVVYHRYLNDALRSALEDSSLNLPGVTPLTRIQDSVVSLKKEPSGFELVTESKNLYHCHTLVIAIGNVAARSKVSQALLSPWDSKTYEDISEKKSIAIVGAGLTAIDIVHEAEARGFRGKYSIISRHAQFAHTNGKQPFLISDSIKAWAKQFAEEQTPLRQRLKAFRSAAKHFAHLHAVVDSLRPHTQSIWRSFSITEKRRFIRHLRAYWDVARHRAPETTLGALLNLKAAGRLHQVKAKLLSACQVGPHFQLELGQTKGLKTVLEFDRAINGMGLCSNIHHSDSPLLSQLLEEGILSADPLNIGLQTNEKGQLISQEGILQEQLYTLGSLRRGELWESIAVPELSVQARLVAESILLNPAILPEENPQKRRQGVP